MASRLRIWRASEDLSQAAAAELIGTSRATYNAVESGRQRPSSAFLVRLQVAFGEPAEAILRPSKPREAIPVVRVTASRGAEKATGAP